VEHDDFVRIGGYFGQNGSGTLRICTKLGLLRTNRQLNPKDLYEFGGTSYKTEVEADDFVRSWGYFGQNRGGSQ
jgi:hypothetical protein